ncbi:hypothetical protein LCGC14_1183880 [marine sediment metagenome]|uniref:Glycosyltransferase 2-like domain-containing protein n=1 Tax=marine sediment metagenome TaxID=412755 RepID=A0A0F9PRV0_9ZZZZ
MIVIGVPVDKNFTIDVRTAAYCSAEAMHPNVKWGYASSREAGVGRSTFAYRALKNPDVTHLYFMDSDVVPPEGTLSKLLDHDVPIVAGIYPMCTDMPCWSFKTTAGWENKDLSLPKGLTETTAIGGSTLLVKREVFEKMERPWFKIVYKAIDEEGRAYDEGEDEYFSRLAREAGYKIMIDPTIICTHYNKRAL